MPTLAINFADGYNLTINLAKGYSALAMSMAYDYISAFEDVVEVTIDTEAGRVLTYDRPA